MSETAYRISAILLVAGAALLAISIVMISTKPVIGQPFPPAASLLLFLASLALLVSLPAMYARQSATSGPFGLVGYVLLQAGIVLIVSLAAAPLLYPSLNLLPGESPVAFFLGIALVIGLLLTGIAVIQAGVFPRTSGILVLAATAGFFFSFFVAEFLPPIAGQISSALFAVVLSGALAWIGILLWAR